MKDHDLKKRIEKFVTKVGSGKAQSLFIDAGMSGSTALQLVNGTYKSEPKRLLIMAIEIAMKEGA